MPSRVPDSLMYQRGQSSLDRTRSTMIKNQEQALTGKRVNRPSDDPVAAMQVMQLNTVMQRDETVNSNLEVATNFLASTDSSLGELSDVLSRLKELAIQMASSTNTEEGSRLAVSREVEQLFTRCVQIGNTRLGDRYIFGGFQVSKPPFDLEGNYFGDEGKFELEMDRGQKIAVNVPGMMPFFGAEDIPNASREIRASPMNEKVPSISGELRDPASIEIENRGLDPVDDADAYFQARDKGGINIFREIKGFLAGLETGNMPLIQNAVEKLDSSFKQVLASRAIVGARQNIAKLSQDSLEAAKVTNSDLKSKSEDADTLKVYADLAKNENALKASLEINRKLLAPSLLEYLK